MSDLTKGVEFTNNEQVTATQLNNLVDDATINTGAVGSDELAVDAVTTDKVQDGAITRDKLAEDAMGVKSIQSFNGVLTHTTSGTSTTTKSERINLNGTDGDAVDGSNSYIINNSDSSAFLSDFSSQYTQLKKVELASDGSYIDVEAEIRTREGSRSYYYNLTLVEHY